MNKKYLGIGFVFGAMDKGVKNFFRSMNNQTSEMEEGVKGINEEGARMGKPGGLVENVKNIGKFLTAAGIVSNLSKIRSAMEGTGDQAGETFMSFEKTAADVSFMNSALKDSGKITGQLMQFATILGDRTSELPQNIADMTKRLQSVGIGFDRAFEGIDRGTSMMDRMTELTGVFKVDQQDAVDIMRMGAKVLQLPKEALDDVIKSSATFSKQFQVTDLFKDLSLQAKMLEERKIFKGMSPKDAQTAWKNAAQLTAAYRSMGLSQEEATQTVTGFYGSLTKARESFSRMAAGITDGTEGIKNAALVTGSMKDAISAIDTADPVKALFHMRKALDNVSEGSQTHRIIIQRIKDFYGEGAAKALGMLYDKNTMTIIKRNQELMKDDKTWAKAREKNYSDYLTQHKNTMKFQEERYQTMKENFNVEMYMLAGPKLRENRKKASEFYKKLRTEVGKTNSPLSKLMINLEILRVRGLGGLIPELAPLAPAFEVFEKAAAPIGVFMWGMSGATKTLFTFGKAAIKVAGVLFTRVIPAILSAGMSVLRVFIPPLVSATIATGKFILSLARSAIALAAQAVAWVATQAPILAYNIAMGISAVVTNAALWPILAIVAGIAALVAMVWLAIKYWKTWTGWISNLIGWFTSLDNSVLGVIAVIMPLVGIPALIIKNWEKLKGAWNSVAGAFVSAWTWVADKFHALFDPIISKITGFFDSISKGIGFLKGAGKQFGSVLGFGSADDSPAPAADKKFASSREAAKSLPGVGAIAQSGMGATKPISPMVAKNLKGKSQQDLLAEVVNALYEVGNQIVGAVSEGKQISVNLVGDAKKFVKVQSVEASNTMARRGYAGQVGG